MVRKPRLLFIYTKMHTTFENDLDILKRHFDVETFMYSGKKDIFRLFRAILRTDINMSRFVLGHARLAVLFSKLLGKKAVVVVEGWDVVSMPEIQYGYVISKKRRRQTRFTLKHANAAIVVSKALEKDAKKIYDRDMTLIYHGVDSEKFKPKGEKENLVITVGLVRRDTYQRKGLKTFVESARYLPDTEFLLIGKHHDDTVNELRKNGTSNVKYLGYVPDDELKGYFQRARVYVQVSAHEGFGISLAEAMLCECVPVVTRRGAIPEVVGSCGYYVPLDEPKATAEAIETALKSNLGTAARERIRNEFPLKRREEALIGLVSNLVKK